MSQKKAYEWDFDGAYDPANGRHVGMAQTFSVGVFQWVPRASKKGLKRGPVVKRIRGFCSNPEEVYRKVREFIASQESRAALKEGK